MSVGEAISGKKYNIELCYGHYEGEDGIHHAFEAFDPKRDIEYEAVADKLASLLDTTPDDTRFAYNSMLVKIPDAVVDRIKNDASMEVKGLNLRVREFDMLIEIQKYLAAEGGRPELASALLKVIIRLSEKREKALSGRRAAKRQQ